MATWCSSEMSLFVWSRSIAVEIRLKSAQNSPNRAGNDRPRELTSLLVFRNRG
jgi:hypothetical protein